MSNLSLDEITKILENSKVINPKDIPQIEKEKFQIQVNKALEEMSIQIKDKNDVSEKLNELSVSLTDDNGKYRSLGDILEDMSKKYNENIKNNKLEQFEKLNNSKLKFAKSDIIDKESLKECFSKKSAIISYIESSKYLINLFETIKTLKYNSNTTTKCLKYIQLVNDNAIKRGLNEKG